MTQYTVLPALLAPILLLACSPEPGGLDEAVQCHVGTYRLDSGEAIDIAPNRGAALRWRALDGRSGSIERGEHGVWSGTAGWGEQPDPARIRFGSCNEHTVTVEGIAGVNGSGTRIAYLVRQTQFQGEGETLAGRLVLPPGEGPFPVAVLVHGSEDTSALDFAYYQRILPAQGVGAFVYDKRGTGRSSGEYTQDFNLLAADAAAALEEARRLAGGSASAVGYLGGSQGGWVAPLAATLGEPDFVIVGFGLAEGPLAEDREEVQTDLVEAGFDDPEILTTARRITDTTGRIMASGFSEGREDLARIRQTYSDEPWYSAIDGEYTGDMLNKPLWRVQLAYFMEDIGTSWEYEPVPVLRQIDVPMLWVLAGADREAPSATTRRILEDLQAEGRPIDIAFFPGAGHSMVRFIEDESGGRTITRYADGYFRLLGDWPAEYAFAGSYGNAELSPRREAE